MIETERLALMLSDKDARIAELEAEMDRYVKKEVWHSGLSCAYRFAALEAKLKIAENELVKTLTSTATDPSKCGNNFFADECRRLRGSAKEALEKLRATK